MYIREMGLDTELKLEVTIGTNKMEFASKVVGVSDKRQRKLLDEASKGYPYTIVEAITRDDKIVGFPSKGVKYKVIYIEESSKKVYEFTSVMVKQIAFPTGERVHMLISPTVMKELNRRENFRLWLGCSAVAQFGLGKENIDVIIKDISATGVSFVMEDKYLEDILVKPKADSAVVLSFHDDTTEANYKLNATIVRLEEVDDTKTIYGCKFKKESSAVMKLINEKQRERAKVNFNKKPEKE